MAGRISTIPKGWKMTTLGEMAGKIFSGGTPNTQIKEYWGGDLGWLSSGETGQRFIYETKKRITQKGANESSTRFADKNNVVIATAGQGNTRGQTSLLKIGTYINQSVIAIDCDKKKADNIWLYYNLSNRYSELRFISESNSIRGSLTTNILGTIGFLLPPLPEQRAMVAVLSSLDDKIELLREQNKILETTAQAIFKEWFINFNFPGATGKLVDSELGKIPQGWRIGEIKDFGEIVCGKTPSKENQWYFGGGIPFIKIPDMHNQVFITTTEDSLTETGGNTQKNKFIPVNSICVSCIATVGLVSITSEKSQTNQQINSIVPSSENYLEYLFFALKNMKDDLLAIGTGGSATLNINTATFSNIEIIFPENEILEKFHHAASPIFQKINFNNSQIKTLSALRDALLPKLMKSQIRVKEFYN